MAVTMGRDDDDAIGFFAVLDLPKTDGMASRGLYWMLV